MKKLLLLSISIFVLLSCETIEPEPAMENDKLEVQLEQKTGESSEKSHDDHLKDCFDKMIESVGADFTGVACRTCIEGDVSAKDSVFLYRVFFSYPNHTNYDDEHSTKWELEGVGGQIIGADSLDYVQIALKEDFGTDTLKVQATSTSIRVNEDGSTSQNICSSPEYLSF